MTLVITAAGPSFFAMVSDRLITLSRDGRYAGDHDTIANKNIVFRTSDAIAAFGYSGNAYIADVPTDQWIAQQLGRTMVDVDGQPAINGYPIEHPPPIAQAIWQLRQAMHNTPEAHNVSVAASGFRVRKGIEISFLLRFSSTGDRRGEYLAMRPAMRPSNFRILWVGGGLGTRVIDEAMRPYFRPEGLDISPDTIVPVLRGMVRDAASRNPTIGSDLMEILLDRGGRREVVCTFNPSDALRRELLETLPEWLRTGPPLLTPWVVGQDRIFAPTVSGGGGALTYNLNGINVVVDRGGGSSSDGGGMSISPAPRRPRPR